MGREIRRVPADWEHPTKQCEHSPWKGGCDTAKKNNGQCYQPLFDQHFEEVAREWLDKAIAWDNGTDSDCAKHKAKHPFYWQWNGDPPDPKYYRPKWTSEPTHYQVYETVSEGTPVTPHFATKGELVDWLVKYGDEWDRIRGNTGWDRKNAEEFVEQEWAPSMIIADGQVFMPKDGNPLGVK
jgi:hypothetical protein